MSDHVRRLAGHGAGGGEPRRGPSAHSGVSGKGGDRRRRGASGWTRPKKERPRRDESTVAAAGFIDPPSPAYGRSMFKIDWVTCGTPTRRSMLPGERFELPRSTCWLPRTMPVYEIGNHPPSVETPS